MLPGYISPRKLAPPCINRSAKVALQFLIKRKRILRSISFRPPQRTLRGCNFSAECLLTRGIQFQRVASQELGCRPQRTRDHTSLNRNFPVYPWTMEAGELLGRRGATPGRAGLVNPCNSWNRRNPRRNRAEPEVRIVSRRGQPVYKFRVPPNAPCPTIHHSRLLRYNLARCTHAPWN